MTCAHPTTYYDACVPVRALIMEDHEIRKNCKVYHVGVYAVEQGGDHFDPDSRNAVAKDGVHNLDIAIAVEWGKNGSGVGKVRDGAKQIDNITPFFVLANILLLVASLLANRRSQAREKATSIVR